MFLPRILHSHKPGEPGFTLIELLVVIAIMGVLAGMIFASLGSIRAVARDRRRVVDITTVHGAIEAYLADGHPFIDETDGYRTQCNEDFVDFLVPNYLSQVLTDPTGRPCVFSGGFYPYYYYAGFRTVAPPNIAGCPLPFYILYAHLETDGVEQARNDDTCNTIPDPTGAGVHENDNRAFVIIDRGRLQ